MSDYFSRTVLKLAGKSDAGCHCCLTVFCGHSYLGRGRGADDHSIQLGIWFKKRQGSKFAFVTLRAREHSHTKNLRTKANLAALSSHDNYLIVNYSTDFVLNHNPDSKSMCHFAEWCFGINRVLSS